MHTQNTHPAQPLPSAMMEAYIAMADALANSIHQTVSLFDTSTMKIIYISPTPDSRQNKYRELALRQSLDIYRDSIPDEERQWLYMAQQHLQPIVARMGAEERKHASLTQYHHYILHDGRKVLIRRTISTVHRNSDGSPRILLTLHTLTLQHDGLFAMLNNPAKKEYYTHDFATHQWEKHCYASLTDNEIQMLMLSNQGYSVEAIADAMNKSTETVKGYRKAVFDKLNVANIQGAIHLALTESPLPPMRSSPRPTLSPLTEGISYSSCARKASVPWGGG